ncbi:hypothetical protein BGX27_003275 [Mortierella sp. AM989]|nr:hypothetical protein BGX27_003275 [Mortierella sp. AM989]
MEWDIVNDEAWVEQALAASIPPPDRELCRRLQMAHSHPSTSDNKERTRMALQNLASLGLVVEYANQSDTSAPMARRIVSTLLDTNQPCPHKFYLRLGDKPNAVTMELPTRSRMLLRHLSQILGINIYLFSSRAQSVLFESAAASQSIGIFHRVDSVNNISEYLVLIASPHVVVAEQKPAPQVEQFSSSVPAATFREEKRKRKRPRPSENNITEEQCQTEFKKACIETIRTRIVAGITPILQRKKFPIGESVDTVLAEKRLEVKEKMLGAVRVPAGTLNQAYLSAQTTYGSSRDFSKDMFSLKLRSNMSNLEQWTQTVTSNFDQAWGMILETSKKNKSSIKEEGSAGDRNMDIDGDGEGDEDNCKTDIRTCSVTLRQILRPDLANRYNDILSIAKKSQEDVSDTISELSVLAQKTVLLIAGGDLYQTEFGQRNEHPRTFDIREVLPDTLVLPEGFRTNMNVAPIPPLLQAHLESFEINQNSKKDDIALLMRKSTGKSGTQEAIAHVALRAPIVLIANKILHATGYHNFARKFSPQVPATSLHALHLGAVGVYEVFCSSGPNQFDIHDAEGNPLTYVKEVTSPPANKEAVLGAFLDLDKIRKICDSHGLNFRNRITFVDRFTIHLTGEVIKHGVDRSGYPVVSRYEERKKDKTSNLENKWKNEFLRRGLTKVETKSHAETATAVVKELENAVKKQRRSVSEKQQLQSLASRRLRDAKGSTPQSEAYASLRAARVNVRVDRKVLFPQEAALRQLRKENYYWNKVDKAASSAEDSKDLVDGYTGTTETRVTIPTWAHPATEDKAEYFNISDLITNARGKNRLIAFAGTDYGLRTMSETVALTQGQIETHINRYYSLFGE